MSQNSDNMSSSSPQSQYSVREYSDAIESRLQNAKKLISALCDELENSSCRQAQLYQLPAIKRGEKGYDGIEVVPDVLHETFAALSLIKRAYRNFSTGEDSDTKYTQKYPGVAVFNDNHHTHKLGKLIDEINDTKSQLDSLFKVKVTFDKDEFFLTRFPGLIKKQVTRQIPVFHGKERDLTVQFYWANRINSSVITRNEAIAKVQSNVDRLKSYELLNASNDAKLSFKSQLLDLLHSMPTTSQLRLRRQQPVRPAVNIYESGNRKPYNFVSSLPMLVFSNGPVVIEELPTWEPNKAVQSSDSYQLLDHYMGLYLLKN